MNKLQSENLLFKVFDEYSDIKIHEVIQLKKKYMSHYKNRV